MKQCPTCDKEFPDSMRFCQTDGTLLVEKTEDVDPYKTIVGNQDDIASAIPPLDPFKTMVANAPNASKKDDDDILDIPSDQDMLKTMIVSPEELKADLKDEKKNDPAPHAPSAPLIEPKPPISAKPPVEPPADVPTPKPENISIEPTVEKKDIFPPFESKPFENDFSQKSPYGNQDSKPIPSPFDLSMPPGYMPPSTSPFEDPKPTSPASPFDEPKASTPPPQNFDEPKPSPFDTPFGGSDPFNQNQPLQQNEWTPPPAPDANWQNQPIGSNSPLQPPVAGGGQNQTLAIVSLVCGVLGILCCGLFTGIPAIVTGFMAKSRAESKPSEFGGKGLAIAGIALGGVSILFSIIGFIYYVIVLGSAASRGY